MYQKTISFLCLGALLGACAAGDSENSGTSSQAKLTVTTSNRSSLHLADGTLKVGDAIELSYAKFSLAKIKVKANKERSDEEKDIEETENTEEEANVNNLDTMALKEKERKEKVRGKKDELKKDEDDKLKKEVARDGDTKFSGPYVFDAIAGAIEGDSPIADLGAGDYRRIQFQMKRNFSVDESEGLFGNVFAIRGTYTNAGVAVPFAIDWHVALNFRVAGDKAMDVAASEDTPVVIDFKVSDWFDGIDWSAAEKDADGTIYINRDTNRAILHAIHKNIKLSAGFGKDKDGDKKLSETERSGVGEDTEDAQVE